MGLIELLEGKLGDVFVFELLRFFLSFFVDDEVAVMLF